MNAARVIHGIAAFMLLGVAFLMLREFAMAYRFSLLGDTFRELQASLPWLSSLILPAAPFAWWCSLTPVFCSIGVATRVPSNSPITLAIQWLILVIIADVMILGAFLPYVKATSAMGYVVATDPTTQQIVVNVVMLVSAGFWMARGIVSARRD